MKIIVTHTSPDWDAITSAWLLKRFLPGWDSAKVQFVPAGERITNHESRIMNHRDPIEKIDDDEVIHVDTGMGPLDHHQTSDTNVCGASRTWDYVQSAIIGGEKWEEKKEAIDRIVKIVVDIDHFKEVFWDNPTADYHEFSLIGLLEGLKLEKQDQDEVYMDFGMTCLDALLHSFENRIWAEKEIKKNGIVFKTKWGKAIGFETINDTVLKLAQKMGYKVVIRKDPRKGYVRIKARPLSQYQISKIKYQKEENIDLTLVYEKLRKIDPEATWYLHVSKKMLLNGTVKNPKMKPTKLSLQEIIKVIETI